MFFLLSVCQCRGQGWREVHDPRRLCPEVSRTTYTDSPQPQNCSAHRCCGWHHKGRVCTDKNTAYTSSQFISTNWQFIETCLIAITATLDKIKYTVKKKKKTLWKVYRFIQKWKMVFLSVIGLPSNSYRNIVTVGFFCLFVYLFFNRGDKTEKMYCSLN